MVCSLSSLPKRCAVVYQGCNDLWLHGCLASFVVFLNQQIAAVRAGDTGDTGEAGPARLLAAGHQLQSPGPALGNIQHLITQSLHGASRDEDITLLRRTGVNAGSPQSAHSVHVTCWLRCSQWSDTEQQKQRRHENVTCHETESRGTCHAHAAATLRLQNDG